MRYQGKVTKWNDERGFGFLAPNDEGKKVFVHIKSFTNRQRRPLVNDIITYDVKTDLRGRLQANNVEFLTERICINSHFLKNLLFIIFSLSFFVFITISMYYNNLPFIVFGGYLIISAITFFAYSLDKSAAENNEWRLPETTLHFLSVFGGWPGALAAQVLIRHKSKKRSFRTIFWTTVGLNCLLLCFMLSNSGSNFLRNNLGLV